MNVKPVTLNLRTIKGIGVIFALLGLAFGVLFAIPVEFDMNPQVWFTPVYYTQFIPLYIAITLLLSGVFIVTHFSQANLYLAVFGHTASEEVIFSWIGLTNTSLSLFSIAIILPLSFIALWMGYFNTLKQRPLSMGEAIFGFVTSTAFILLPRYL